ncbi:hypothetical protein FKM82_027444 [Ascaphus truei]
MLVRGDAWPTTVDLTGDSSAMYYGIPTLHYILFVCLQTQSTTHSLFTIVIPHVPWQRCINQGEVPYEAMARYATLTPSPENKMAFLCFRRDEAAFRDLKRLLKTAVKRITQVRHITALMAPETESG